MAPEQIEGRRGGCAYGHLCVRSRALRDGDRKARRLTGKTHGEPHLLDSRGRAAPHRRASAADATRCSTTSSRVASRRIPTSDGKARLISRVSCVGFMMAAVVPRRCSRASPSTTRTLVTGVAAAPAALVVGIAGTVLVSRLGTGRTAAPISSVARVLVNIARPYLRRSPRTAPPSKTPVPYTMAWSPDDHRHFSACKLGRQQLYRRALNQLVAVPILGTDGAANPFFSPDGQWVGFWSDGQLKKIAADGSGPATTICDISPACSARVGERTARSSSRS